MHSASGCAQALKIGHLRGSEQPYALSTPRVVGLNDITVGHAFVELLLLSSASPKQDALLGMMQEARTKRTVCSV